MKVKLIRDKVLPRGTGVSVEVASRSTHIALLGAKLHEEAQEIVESHCRKAEEYADLLQVLVDLALLNGVPVREIEQARANKKAAKGGFLAGRVMVVDRAKGGGHG
ncbi:MAG TPA: hypothetical protein EYP07_07855 [Kiloniellaceae bacterium]|nr:hypothetical protein [Kiloniellaceae bacterium]